MHQMAMLDRIYTPLDEDLISSVSQNQNKSIKGSMGPWDPGRTPTNQNITLRREIEGDQELEWYDAIIGNVGTALCLLGPAPTNHGHADDEGQDDESQCNDHIQVQELYLGVGGRSNFIDSSIGGLTSGDLAAREAEYFRERKGMLEGKKE